MNGGKEMSHSDVVRNKKSSRDDSSIKGLGRFTFFSGIVCTRVSFFWFIGTQRTTYFTEMNKVVNTVFYLFLLSLGIFLMVLGEYKWNNRIYHEGLQDLIGRYSLKKIRNYKILALLSSIILMVGYLYELIRLFPIIKSHFYSSIRYSFLLPTDVRLFYGVLQYVIPVIGCVLLIIWYLRDFGKKKGTLFSSALLVFGILNYYYFFLVFLDYLMSTIFSDQRVYTINSVWDYTLFISYALTGLIYFLISYNKKKVFPSMLMKILVGLLFVITLYDIFVFGWSVYNSFKYSYYGLNLGKLCNLIISLQTCGTCSMFCDLYYIKIIKQNKRYYWYNRETEEQREGEGKSTLTSDDNVPPPLVLDLKNSPILFCRKCGRRLTAGMLQCVYCGTQIQTEDINEENIP